MAPPKEELEAAKLNKTGKVEFINSTSSTIGTFRMGQTWGGCNGGQGKYGTTINQEKGQHSKNKVQAKRCLEKANQGFHWKWGKCVIYLKSYHFLQQKNLLNFFQDVIERPRASAAV